jgi:hypothetical protein
MRIIPKWDMYSDRSRQFSTPFTTIRHLSLDCHDTGSDGLTMPNHKKRPKPIVAREVRYIRLAKRGSTWEQLSLDNGELHFGYGGISHAIAKSGNLKSVTRAAIKSGRDATTAAQDARQVLDFYKLGANCLWITFARDHLWWTFAKPGVIWQGGSPEKHGERIRRSIGGWRNTDIHGAPLRIDGLSTRLTQVAGYRRTICAVGPKDYLLRRINGAIEPLVQRGTKSRNQMLDVLTDAIGSLHWQDFETLADVIFARSGWHRASAIGGKQAVVDLVLEQPTIGEFAAVQVKSKANQAKLDAFVRRADASGSYDRLFFVCHSPVGTLKAPAGRDDIHLWTGRQLAATALRTGLADWIIEKIV